MRLTAVPANMTVPAGWTTEVVGDQHILVRSPGGYMATIDLERRWFCSWMTTNGRPASIGKFAGRGWRSLLTQAAVDYLMPIETSRRKARP